VRSLSPAVAHHARATSRQRVVTHGRAAYLHFYKHPATAASANPIEARPDAIEASSGSLEVDMHPLHDELGFMDRLAEGVLALAVAGGLLMALAVLVMAIT
jgi:hypothetical protein